MGNAQPIIHWERLGMFHERQKLQHSHALSQHRIQIICTMGAQHKSSLYLRA